jgi:hypothetical protein
MCCFFTTLLLLGPRAGILIWWLINPLVADQPAALAGGL